LTLTDVYIAVGSNIDPEENVPAAVRVLALSVDLVAVSTFYWSAPLDRPEQPRFMNGVLRIRTALEPRPLKFELLRPIEARLGRVRGADRDAPRTIDLDIALYGDRVLDDDFAPCDDFAPGDEGLRVPDPDIRIRPFIAVPLLELAPGLVLPDTGERLASVRAATDRTGLVEVSGMKQLLKERT